MDLKRLNSAIISSICILVCCLIAEVRSDCGFVTKSKALIYDNLEKNYKRAFYVMDLDSKLYRLKMNAGSAHRPLEAIPVRLEKYEDVVKSISIRWPITAFCDGLHSYYAMLKSPSFKPSDPKIWFSRIELLPGHDDPSYNLVSDRFRELFAVIGFTEDGLGFEGKGYDFWSYHLGSLADNDLETVYFVKNSELIGTVVPWREAERSRRMNDLPHYLIEYGHRAIVLKNDGTYVVGDMDRLISLNETRPMGDRIFNKVTNKYLTGIKAILYNRKARSKRELYRVLADDGFYYQLDIERTVEGIKGIYLAKSEYSNKDLRRSILNRGAITVTTDGDDYYYALINATQQGHRVPQSRLSRYDLFFGKRMRSEFDTHPNDIAALYIKFPNGSSQQFSYYYEEREQLWQVYLHRNKHNYDHDLRSIYSWKEFALKTHLLPHFIIPLKEDVTKGFIFYHSGKVSIGDIEKALAMQEDAGTAPTHIPIRCF